MQVTGSGDCHQGNAAKHLSLEIRKRKSSAVYLVSIRHWHSSRGSAPNRAAGFARGHAPANKRFAALSTLARTLIEKRGQLSEQELDSFIAAGFTKEHVLEVIVIVAASTITNYAGTITNPPQEDPFRQHAWRGQHGCSRKDV